MDEYQASSYTTWKTATTTSLSSRKCSKKDAVPGASPAPARRFCKWRRKEVEDRGGTDVLDHVHMLISFPPKYAVSQVVGSIKGKSVIHLARAHGERKRNFVGQHFWARGYFVNTAGRDEEAILGCLLPQPGEGGSAARANFSSGR